MKKKEKKEVRSSQEIVQNQIKPRGGWKYLRVCKKCSTLVREGQTCPECGEVWRLETE